MQAYCFRCKKSYTEYPALSRRDNSTDICSKCGNEEALNDFAKLDNIPIENLIVEREFHEKIGADYKIWIEWKHQLQSEVGFSSRGIQ